MSGRSITISFLGDIGLNDGYREDYREGKNPFAGINPVLANSDFVVGNLEVVCGGDEGENLQKVPRLKTDEDTMHYLEELSLDLVTLAGNHVFDNLSDGFRRTTAALDRMGIDYVGAAMVGAGRREFAVAEVGGFKLAFLNYLHPSTHPHLPAASPVIVTMYDEERILETVREAKLQADRVFLSLHWGVDNSFFPAPWQRRAAGRFIEAGVDCIIGHHSHTLQGYEAIDEGFVFYSLGNFCFSDFTFDGRFYQWDRKRHLHSAVIRLRISETELRFEAVPIRIAGREVAPEAGSNHIARVSQRLPLVSSPFGWGLYMFYLSAIHKVYFFFLGNGRNPWQRLRTLNMDKVRRFFRLLAGGFRRSG